MPKQPLAFANGRDGVDELLTSESGEPAEAAKRAERGNSMSQTHFKNILNKSWHVRPCIRFFMLAFPDLFVKHFRFR